MCLIVLMANGGYCVELSCVLCNMSLGFVNVQVWAHHSRRQCRTSSAKFVHDGPRTVEDERDGLDQRTKCQIAGHVRLTLGTGSARVHG
jgi:hypothetical protein